MADKNTGSRQLQALLKRLASANEGTRLMAQREARSLPLQEQKALIEGVLRRLDAGLTGDLLHPAASVALLFGALGFLYFVFQKELFVLGACVIALFAGVVAVLSGQEWLQFQRLTAWLDSLEDAQFLRFVLPDNPRDKKKGDVERMKLMRRLLPRLQQKDWKHWTPGQKGKLLYILQTCMLEVDITLASIPFLQKIDDPAFRAHLQHLTRLTALDAFNTLALERFPTLRADMATIRQAALAACPEEILLRPATSPGETAPNDLLRPASPSVLQEPPDQLLRPGNNL
jgi:hypothetical protein